MTFKIERFGISSGLNIVWNKTYVISIEERLEEIAEVLSDTRSLNLLENKYQTRYKKLQNYMKNSKIKMEKATDRAEKENIYRESVIHVHRTLEKMLHNEISLNPFPKSNVSLFDFLQKEMAVSMAKVFERIISGNGTFEFLNEKSMFISEEVKIVKNLEYKELKKRIISKSKIISYRIKDEINIYRKIIELSDLRGRAPGNLSLAA